MRSMTGYGKGVLSENDRQLTVEVRTVNNRYLEVNCRTPRALSFIDDDLRREIKERLSRGTADVFVNYVNASADNKRLRVDGALAGAYSKAARELAAKYGLENDYGVTALMREPDVVTIEAAEEDEAMLRGMVKKCLGIALDGLVAMREAEGATIQTDLAEKTDNIEGALKKVIKRAPEVVEAYRAKLAARIREALDSVDLDEARLLNEVAFFADKADVNEEISRLSSHLAQFRAALTAPGPQGRNLDFVSQEMGREINTLGSKSNDAELTKLVIYMKNELEKIKEQIRNVE